MARTTKRSRETAARLGGLATASQVERWTAEGYGPAGPPRKDDLAHWQLLAPLMGTGRDADVAVLRMAGEHGRACQRLREVLLGLMPPPGVVGELEGDGDAVLAAMPGAISEVSGGKWGDLTDMSPLLARGATIAPLSWDSSIFSGVPLTGPEIRSGALNDARLRIAQAVAGEKATVNDNADLTELLSAGTEDTAGSQVTGTLFDADEMHNIVEYSAKLARGQARAWVREASTDELVQGVMASARGFVPMLEAAGGVDLSPMGTEERWHFIGMMAPGSYQLSKQLAAFASVMKGEPVPMEDVLPSLLWLLPTLQSSLPGAGTSGGQGLNGTSPS
ncbi:MAG: hypothetical protein M0005_10300 [Actinomycetota bacterium]|nr:hypothetical protein [Actinomycetota bacterium]